MINVQNATKAAWLSGTTSHTVSITIGSSFFSNTDIIAESLSIDEILEDNEYLQFTGCNCSKASFTLFGINTSYKGQFVIINAQAGNTEVIPLFIGFVDEQETKDYTTGETSFVCYDMLYTIGQIDVANWYKNLTFPLTLGSFRTQLFNYLAFPTVATTLVNDSIQIDRQYIPVNLPAISVIKAICQINAVYGIINRNSVFEYRSLTPITSGSSSETAAYYKKIDYQRYTVASIEKVIIRQSDDEVGASYGSEGNTYIVQANMFTYNLDDVVLRDIAENIYGKVNGLTYIPYSAETYAMPWLEVGDIITYPVYDISTETSTNIEFYVLSRKLKGIQAMFDSTSAEGEQYQTVFISDVSIQIDAIKASMKEMQRAIDNAVIKHYQAHNAEIILLSDNYVKILDFLPFQHFSTNITDFVFEGSIVLDATTTEVSGNDSYDITPVQAEIKYVLNGNDVSYIPVEIYEDGTHTLTLNYQFAGVVKNTRTNLEVYMKATTGSISIPANKALGYLWGQNLDKLEIVKIEITQLPNKVEYYEGESLDLTGLIVTGTYNDGQTIDVTSSCTYEPADGDTLVGVGSQDIIVTFGEGADALQDSFSVEVEALEPLKYLQYLEQSNRYLIRGIKTAEIEADELKVLRVPKTWNGKELVLEK